MRHPRRYALVGVVLALGTTAALAEARGRVVMHDGFMYKPHEFAVSGDGDFLVRGLHWRSWGGGTAVADGQAIEQQRPSHVEHTYSARVTLSRRTYCANLHRTVYNELVAEILGPSPGVFGERTLGRVYTCGGTWRLVTPPPRHPRPAPPPTRTTARHCSTRGIPSYVRAISQHGSTCARARTLVLDWFQRLKQPGGNKCSWADGSTRPGRCMVGKWHCTSTHTVNGQTYPVTCTKDAGHRRVHFVNQV